MSHDKWPKKSPVEAGEKLTQAAEQAIAFEEAKGHLENCELTLKSYASALFRLESIIENNPITEASELVRLQEMQKFESIIITTEEQVIAALGAATELLVTLEQGGYIPASSPEIKARIAEIAKECNTLIERKEAAQKQIYGRSTPS